MGGSLPELFDIARNWRCERVMIQNKLCSSSFELKDCSSWEFPMIKAPTCCGKHQGSFSLPSLNLKRWHPKKQEGLRCPRTSAGDESQFWWYFFCRSPRNPKMASSKSWRSANSYYGWVVREKENARPPPTVHETLMFLMFVKWTCCSCNQRIHADSGLTSRAYKLHLLRP